MCLLTRDNSEVDEYDQLEARYECSAFSEHSLKILCLANWYRKTSEL